MDPENCTLQTCSIEDAYVTYQPTIAGNSIYTALFGILLIAQIVQCPIYRMWGFSGSMIAGLILEVLGYIGRILSHDDPFSFDWFLMNLICLTIGPVFFCAAIYFLLGQIVVAYQGEAISRLRPRNYTIVFVSCDIISLVLVSAGGAITSNADDNPSLSDTGVNIMIAGLACQVAALTIFICLALEFAFRMHRHLKHQSLSTMVDRKDEFEKLRAKKWWKVFLLALVLATITVYARSIFRVVELNGGFDSALANDEIAFMILEGAMISITCLCLTVLHPGKALGTRRKKSDMAENIEF
ncbi:RTA1 like protein-domain-containing protein [Aspergillus unguis]